MKLKKFNTENYECWIAKVGEVAIGNEAIPVYEISVKIIENKRNDLWDVIIAEYDQEFLDMAQKLWDEIQKEHPFSLALIYSNINRYYFWKFERCTEWGSDNPVTGFLQAWMYDGSDWLTWKASKAVNDKLEKDEAFRTALEKWALAKFLQLVFGDKSLPFAPPRYGSERNEYIFMNGRIRVGQLKEHFFDSKVGGLTTDLPTFAYAIWDEECDDFVAYFDKTLTEEELEQLHKYICERERTRQRHIRDYLKKR